MQNLLDFIRKYHDWFLLVILELVSFFLLFSFEHYPNSVWFTSANRVAASVNGLYADAVSYLHLQQVNTALTQRNVMLQMQVDNLREQLRDARVDTGLTNERMVSSLAGYKMIGARVVQNSIREKNNYLVINKGEADGIRPEMGVVSGTGVVGIVYLTGARYSLVLPLINSKSSISCRIRGQRFFGFLKWEGGSPVHAYLDDIPRYARLKGGEFVETSGYSSIFPPGLFVGQVRKVTNSDDGLSYRLDIGLATDFANLRDVVVIASENKASIDTLRVHALEAVEALDQ